MQVANQSAASPSMLHQIAIQPAKFFTGSVGLELAAGKDGKAVSDHGIGQYKVDSWSPCPPMPGCITVNIGDTLQLWSDGVLKSNFHRVRMPQPHELQVLGLGCILANQGI